MTLAGPARRPAAGPMTPGDLVLWACKAGLLTPAEVLHVLEHGRVLLYVPVIDQTVVAASADPSAGVIH